ncbi:UbiA-like protein EboC [Aquirufa sp. ROCK-SH2]
MGKIRAFLELTRPANVITALTDILAGMAIVGFTFGWKNYQISSISYLCLSSMCLYAGGVVFNDIFDRKLDAIERPERALPSGRIRLSEAISGGIALLAAGVILAFLQSRLSGIIASFIVILVLLYDWKSKHNGFFGPFNMGLCRAFNLLLGMSVYELGVLEYGELMIVPLVYIFAITLVSRGEVHGSKPWPLWIAALLFIFVHVGQLHFAYKAHSFVHAIPFVCLHIYLIFKPLSVAIQNPIGPNIGKTVKAGVLSLIVMNAAWISTSDQWYLAILVVALLPLSIRIGKYFAVT